jgi:hypothetical protein
MRLLQPNLSVLPEKQNGRTLGSRPFAVTDTSIDFAELPWSVDDFIRLELQPHRSQCVQFTHWDHTEWLVLGIRLFQ